MAPRLGRRLIRKRVNSNTILQSSNNTELTLITSEITFQIQNFKTFSRPAGLETTSKNTIRQQHAENDLRIQNECG